MGCMYFVLLDDQESTEKAKVNDYNLDVKCP